MLKSTTSSWAQVLQKSLRVDNKSSQPTTTQKTPTGMGMSDAASGAVNENASEWKDGGWGGWGPEPLTAEEIEAGRAPEWFQDQEMLCFVQLVNRCTPGKGGKARTSEIGLAFMDSRTLNWADRGDRWISAFEAIQKNAESFAIVEHDHIHFDDDDWADEKPDCDGGMGASFHYGNGEPTWVRLAEVRNRVVERIKQALGDEQHRKIGFLFYNSRKYEQRLRALDISLEKEFPNSYQGSIEGRHRVCIGISNALCAGVLDAEVYMGHLGLGQMAFNESHAGNLAVLQLQSMLAADALDDQQYDQVTCGKNLRLPEITQEAIEEAAGKYKSSIIKSGKETVRDPKKPKQDPTKMVQPALPLVPILKKQTVSQSATIPPPSWLQNGSVVCCIDLENHCYNQTAKQARKGNRSPYQRTSEIGIAFADGRTLRWEDRGDRFHTAYKAIEESADDFAIIEHNHQAPHHPAGWCYESRPEHFSYGDPKWIYLHNTRYTIVSRIREVLGDLNNTNTPYSNSTPIEFVFFAGHNDQKWLRRLEIDLTIEFPNSTIVDLQSTSLCQKVSRSLSKAQCNAGDFMRALGISHPGAHNGGNDAVHELQAYLAMCALTGSQRDKVLDGGCLPMIERDHGSKKRPQTGGWS